MSFKKSFKTIRYISLNNHFSLAIHPKNLSSQNTDTSQQNHNTINIIYAQQIEVTILYPMMHQKNTQLKIIIAKKKNKCKLIEFSLALLKQNIKRKMLHIQPFLFKVGVY